MQSKKDTSSIEKKNKRLSTDTKQVIKSDNTILLKQLQVFHEIVKDYLNCFNCHRSLRHFVEMSSSQFSNYWEELSDLTDGRKPLKISGEIWFVKNPRMLRKTSCIWENPGGPSHSRGRWRDCHCWCGVVFNPIYLILFALLNLQDKRSQLLKVCHHPRHQTERRSSFF